MPLTSFFPKALSRNLPRNFRMAWRSSGTTNASLIENLKKNGLITSEPVKVAMLKVDRAHYAPTSPYEDSPQSIGYRATISAPHMHASALETLFAPPFSPPTRTRPLRALDIGSGSGYLTHCMADLVGDGGYVVGVEHIQPLRDLGDRNMRKSEEGRRLVESGKARFVVADGRQGYDDPSPDLAAQVADKMGQEKWDVKGWDIIHVGAGAVKLHEALIEQLRRPGRMFIPVDEERGYGQSIWVVEKGADGRVERKRLYAVQYVPLTDPHNDPY